MWAKIADRRVTVDGCPSPGTRVMVPRFVNTSSHLSSLSLSISLSRVLCRLITDRLHVSPAGDMRDLCGEQQSEGQQRKREHGQACDPSSRAPRGPCEGSEGHTGRRQLD